MFICDSKSKGGGVVFYVKNCFSVHLSNSSSLSKKFDYVALAICVGGGAQLTVISIDTADCSL